MTQKKVLAASSSKPIELSKLEISERFVKVGDSGKSLIINLYKPQAISTSGDGKGDDSIAEL